MLLDDAIFSRNETLRSIRDRHSVRTFTGDDVSDDEIKVLLHAETQLPLLTTSRHGVSLSSGAGRSRNWRSS